MGALGKLTVSAAIGVLIGLAAVVWIEPDNAGGSALVIVVCTAVAIVAGAAIKAVRNR